MGNWFKKNLGDAMFAGEHLDHLEARYVSVYGKTNPPENLAVFYRHESEGRLHCEVWAYFSPAAVELAGAVAAEPCTPPSQDSLSLLIGSEDCWTVLFPELPD
ncbi:MAG: hypothetical protein KQI78_14965 [Deltaproteobacteria bacterium]|nr:hypothetical protein [Deltaproteobacteria bacterium]